MENYPTILSLPQAILAQILAGTTNCDQIMKWREVHPAFMETIKLNIRFIYNIMRSRNPYLMRIWPKGEAEKRAQNEYDDTLEHLNSDFKRFEHACKLRFDLSDAQLGSINLELVPERHKDPFSYTRAVYCAIKIANPHWEENVSVDKIKVKLAVYIFYVKNGITPDVAYYYAKSERGVGKFMTPHSKNERGRSKEIAARPEVRSILATSLYAIPVLKPYDTPRVPLAAVRAVDSAVLKAQRGDAQFGNTPFRIELTEAFVRLGPKYAERYMARKTENLEYPSETVNDAAVWDATFNTPDVPEVVPWQRDAPQDVNRYNPKFTAEAILAEAKRLKTGLPGARHEFLGEPVYDL